MSWFLAVVGWGLLALAVRCWHRAEMDVQKARRAEDAMEKELHEAYAKIARLSTSPLRIVEIEAVYSLN